MIARGFIVQFPSDAQQQTRSEAEPRFDSYKAKDLSSWLWSSIDNDDSKDLDQIEYALREAAGTRIYIGIADVDWFVPYDSPLDHTAWQNTTSIYTGVVTFPMLPERLSTDLSSLNENENRLAVVMEVLVSDDGRIAESAVYPAIVRNQSQLTYDGVAAWLEGLEEKPGDHLTEASQRTLQKIANSAELQSQLRLQDATAALLRQRRHEAGALTFHTAELQPVLADGEVVDLQTRGQNRASLLIEDFMIAANQASAAFLDAKGSPGIQRVVQTPHRWDRIVELAASLGSTLPRDPDAKSLEGFLKEQQRTSPEHFPDLSLAVIKLLGRGEYVVKKPGQESTGHFGLAVTNYSHSTAPNRRYPDLITQRLLKAAFAGAGPAYTADALSALAKHCTEKENDANRVERFVKKCAAAAILSKQIGARFDAVVSGVNADGTWVRLRQPPVEGRLLIATQGMDVGHRVRVRLVSADPERGFIDFQIA
jgi:exoribonuclease-2